MRCEIIGRTHTSTMTIPTISQQSNNFLLVKSSQSLDILCIPTPQNHVGTNRNPICQ